MQTVPASTFSRLKRASVNNLGIQNTKSPYYDYQTIETGAARFKLYMGNKSLKLQIDDGTILYGGLPNDINFTILYGGIPPDIFNIILYGGHP